MPTLTKEQAEVALVEIARKRDAEAVQQQEEARASREEQERQLQAEQEAARAEQARLQALRQAQEEADAARPLAPLSELWLEKQKQQKAVKNSRVPKPRPTDPLSGFKRLF